MNIMEMAEVIRSKNAGPGIMTFDIIFKNTDYYDVFVKNNILSKEKVAELYSVSVDDVRNIVNYERGKAIKIAVVRPVLSGNVGDTDVYGCQQVAPFYTIDVPDAFLK